MTSDIPYTGCIDTDALTMTLSPVAKSTGGNIEVGAQSRKHVGPDGCTGLCHSSTRVGVLLQQLHVTVPSAHGDIAQFGSDPHILSR